jgi:hypothetical protein
MKTDRANQLREYLSLENFKDFETLVSAIMQSNDPDEIVTLFSVIDDQCEDYEIMFSLIHALETLSDVRYVDEYLARIENMYTSSPRWSSILLIRVVNNSDTLSLLRKALVADPAKRKIVGVVRERSMKIKKDMPVI